MKITSITTYSVCTALALILIPPAFLSSSVSAFDIPIVNNTAERAETKVDKTTEKVTEKLNREELKKISKQELEVKKAQLKEHTSEQSVAPAVRLDSKKLEICTKNQDKIAASMKRASDQRFAQLDVFKKIADRTIAFKDSKGLSVTNYDQLIADINTKYEAAKTIVGTIDATSSFDCHGSNPKDTLATFRDVHSQNVTALREYKTSIKNLIVAVKSAHSRASQPEVEAR